MQMLQVDKDVAKIRDLMTKRRLQKIPGYTWIEVDNIIHQFGAGESSHPRSKEIDEMLRSWSQKMDSLDMMPAGFTTLRKAPVPAETIGQLNDRSYSGMERAYRRQDDVFSTWIDDVSLFITNSSHFWPFGR
ncbi:pentatricopeptide repeat-containing protein [Populus alba x Populus x berolinensis]|nr:pentatricopeptide repeat-containing protein [Populus alba x Populus x berolinensis]